MWLLVISKDHWMILRVMTFSANWMNQNMLTGVNEIDNFVQCRAIEGDFRLTKKENVFLIIRETDSFIVTRELSDLSNLDS